jgi:hypothetical protein
VHQAKSLLPRPHESSPLATSCGLACSLEPHRRTRSVVMMKTLSAQAAMRLSPSLVFQTPRCLTYDVKRLENQAGAE